MLRIEVRQLSKEFPPAGRSGRPVKAVDDVSCSVDPGEIFFLLGPSGCGKTTLLRMLAGFVTPSSGQILLDDRDVTNMPPEKRQLAMVFQNYALWPHMTVERNVEFGPRTARWPAPKRKQAVEEMLAMVGMQDRRHHKPSQLSGGQQQRVALARALAIRPQGLLLDEPLSNLDAQLRARMRTEIRRLVKGAGATAVYVTHDQEEALSMADRVAVMDQGRIVQVGPPQEVYRRPANRFVADFLGEANFIAGKTMGREGNCLVVETPHGKVFARHDDDIPVGTDVTCCLRPESLQQARPPGAPDENHFTARCVDSTYFGQATRYNLVLGSTNLPLRALAIEPWLAVRPGEMVEVAFAPENVVILAG